MIELYGPQKEAVTKMVTTLTESNIALNCSSTGTGKTLMALEAAKELGLLPLICCPLSATATWARWGNELNIPVLDIINLEKLRTGRTPYVSLNGSAKKGQFIWNLDRTKHMTIVDEAHKGPTGIKSITGKLLAMLRPQGIKTLLLTATPPATPLGMKALGYLCRLHGYNTADYFRWCRQHACTDSPWHRGLIFGVGTPKAKRAMEQINQALRPILTKVSVEDIASHFQNNLVEPWLISLSNDETGRVQAIYDEMEDEIKKSTHSNPLVIQLRARQCSELLKLPAIHDAVLDSIEEGYNVFVALGFKASVEQLSVSLGKAGVAVVRITGDLGQAERDSAVTLFNSGLSRVLVGTISAGGVSISLHHTEPDQRPRTSIISPSYSASEFLQALGRIHRAGALSPVVQRIPLVAGSIEQKIARRIEAKLSALSTLTDTDMGKIA